MGPSKAHSTQLTREKEDEDDGEIFKNKECRERNPSSGTNASNCSSTSNASSHKNCCVLQDDDDQAHIEEYDEETETPLDETLDRASLASDTNNKDAHTELLGKEERDVCLPGKDDTSPDDEYNEQTIEELEELLSTKPPALDGGWGWMCVLGCALMHVLIGGLLRSYGVIYVKLRGKFGSSATITSWVGGGLTALMMGLGGYIIHT